MVSLPLKSGAKILLVTFLVLAITIGVSSASAVKVAGTWEGVSFKDVQWEYGGKLYKKVTVYVGNIVIPHLYLYSLYDGFVNLKIEVVKNVPLGTDVVVDTFYVSPELTSGTNDIKLKSLSLSEGSYFLRVYIYTGWTYEPEEVTDPNWKRIDPWTNPVSNPGRSEVTFVYQTTPTPHPTTPTPSPTPTVSFVDVQYRSRQGTTGKFLTVDTGEQVSAIVSVSASAPTTTYIRIEWVKDIPYSPDQVANSYSKRVSLSTGTNTVIFAGLTSTLGEGKYFVRVYKYENGNYVRIDPWTNPVSNPGRSEVTFKSITPTPTPSPTPTYPYPTPTPTTPTPTPTPAPVIPQPGFEAVFAIAGLIAVAYLLLRKQS